MKHLFIVKEGNTCTYKTTNYTGSFSEEKPSKLREIFKKQNSKCQVTKNIKMPSGVFYNISKLPVFYRASDHTRF